MKPEQKKKPEPPAFSPGPERRSLLDSALALFSEPKKHLSYRLAQGASSLRRGMASLRTRGVAATWKVMLDRLLPRRWQPPALVLYADGIDPARIRLPCAGEPRASIVIPVYDQLHYTLRCLHSLMHSGDAAKFEVIVADDGSSDASAETLPHIDGLRYLRNRQNLGYIGACNAGAALARGQFLVFLNNDTLVQPGWLDALLSTFDTHPDTGLAGSKLVYPDGRLQEAGGIVFSDGSAGNYGRFGNPSDPRYNFVRETDYCSGAAIAIARDVFAALDGFDRHYAPAYYEDTDFAMRVRQRGLKVRYQPASVVVHYEGISSGTDTGQGVKAYQITNQKKFRERWATALAQSHPSPALKADMDAAARHRAALQVLIIDAHTPTPDRDSGSVRMLELMNLLGEQGCALTFFCQGLSHDGRYTEALQRAGVEAWWQPWIKSVPHWLKEHGRRFDAIVVSRHYVLAPLLPLLRECAPQAQIVFDTVDLHFLREQRAAEHAGEPARKQAAARTRETELALIRQADMTWVVSPFEKTLLHELEPRARIEVVSNIHRVFPDTPGFSERRDLVFVGSYRHPPNVDAARWLAEEIFPLIRKQRPDIGLHLVGGDAPEAVRALGQREGIVYHGHVADLDGLLDRTRIGLAPLRFGAGIKGKINQSLARGLPMVASSCAVEGMDLQDGVAVLTADSAEPFAQAVLRLYDDAIVWNRLRAEGFANTRRNFSRDAARRTLSPWLESLGRS